jgi:hypothetical protein
MKVFALRNELGKDNSTKKKKTGAYKATDSLDHPMIRKDVKENVWMHEQLR